MNTDIDTSTELLSKKSKWVIPFATEEQMEKLIKDWEALDKETIDVELLPLLEAINALPGLVTISSIPCDPANRKTHGNVMIALTGDAGVKSYMGFLNTLYTINKSGLSITHEMNYTSARNYGLDQNHIRYAAIRWSTGVVDEKTDTLNILNMLARLTADQIKLGTRS